MHAFEDIIKALKIATPICFTARGDASYAQCFEASVCGADVLKTFGLEAEIVPCALVMHNITSKAMGFVRLEPTDIYEMIDWGDKPAVPFDEWVSSWLNVGPANGLMAHMILRAVHDGRRASIDLTVGQLRNSHGIAAPMTYHWFHDDWCGALTKDGWEISWTDHPRPTQILATVEEFSHSSNRYAT